MRTEISAKFTRPRIEADFKAAGLTLEQWYTDADELFALSLGRRALTPRRTRVRAMQIDGSGALVAGGASGLGEATARGLHALGARVVIADLNEERGNALAGELGERPSSSARDVTTARPCRPPSAPPPTGAGCGSRSAAPASAGPSGSPAGAGRTRSSRSRR